MKCSVYYLCSSDDPTPRYVGQTKSKLNQRLKNHIREAKKALTNSKSFGSPIQRWVRSKLNQGHKIEIHLIDACATWDVTEVVMIERYRAMGHPLLNVLLGGRDTISAHKKRKKAEKRKAFLDKFDNYGGVLVRKKAACNSVIG